MLNGYPPEYAIWLILLLFPAIVVLYEDYILHTRYGKEWKVNGHAPFFMQASSFL